jgi:hypothetical protein
MSRPISARITVAACRLTPGIVQSRQIRERNVACPSHHVHQNLLHAIVAGVGIRAIG